MTELLPKLIPLLVVDVLNPVLFVLLVVAVGTNRPFANSIALVAGHTAAYFFSGIIIFLALTQITDRLNDPLPVDYVIQLFLGLFCLWAALASRDGKASEERNPVAELTPAFCFGYGAIVNFIGVPFALPYFAAVNLILKSNLSVESSLAVMAVYNFAYALPFLAVPILVALIGVRSKPILDRINKLLIGLVDGFMPIILFLLGIALTADSLAFLVFQDALW